MKIGNISFTPEAFKDWSFTDFQKGYAGKLQGYDIGEAYKLLTGRDPVINEDDGKTERVVEKTGSLRPDGKRRGGGKGK